MLALAAIFGADYEAAADGRGFTLRVSPHAGGDAAVSGAGAALEIRYPDSYPSAPPTLTVWPLGGLPQGACDALAADLRQVAAASAGDVCAFALATRAADWLADATLARPLPAEPSADAAAASLWDDAMRRAAAASAAAVSGPRAPTPPPPRAAAWTGGAASTLRLFDDDGAFPARAPPPKATPAQRRPASAAPPLPPRAPTPIAPDAGDRSVSGIFRSVAHSLSSAVLRRGGGGSGDGLAGGRPPPPPPGLDAMASLRRDLLLCHALRLAATGGGASASLPPHALPALAADLASRSLLPSWAASVLAGPPAALDAALARAFGPLDARAVDPGSAWAVDAFWRAAPPARGAGPGTPASRYATDFEEQAMLGRGGFGVVVAATNRLDGRRYAVKKIALRARAPAAAARILREVATLSRLQHPNVVRYFNCWLEDAPAPARGRGEQRGGDAATTLGSTEPTDTETPNETPTPGDRHWFDSKGPTPQAASAAASSSGGLWQRRASSTAPDTATTEPDASSASENSSGDGSARPPPAGDQTLYIQMELCPRTLRAALDAGLDADPWTVLRQVLAGLAHCHAAGVIHRDLKPANIFFDARGDVRLADFGLARFVEGGGSGEDGAAGSTPTLRPGAGADVTSGVGTAAYLSPEVEEGWPSYDDRVDLYSTGVIAFELFAGAFKTGMERALALRALRATGRPPASWDESPDTAAAARVVAQLLARNPADRPSAAALLRSDLLPPVVGDEAAAAVLRTLAGGGDDAAPLAARVVDALFAAPGDAGAAADPDEAPGAPAGAATSTVSAASGALAAAWRARGAAETASAGLGYCPPDAPPDAVRLLDAAGAMLALRYELRAPFAAWLARHGVEGPLARCEVGAVRRRAVGRALPRVFVCADYDVVTPAGASLEDDAAAEAEVIAATLDGVAAAAAAAGGAAPPLEVRLGHPDLLLLALAAAGVPEPSQPATLAALAGVLAISPADARARAAAWPPARAALAGAGVPARAQGALRRLALAVPGEAGAALHRAAAELGAPPPGGAVAASKRAPTTHAATPPLTVLATLRSALAACGIAGERVLVDPLLAPSADYVSGAAFSVFAPTSSSAHHPSLLAAGGRYDRLLRAEWAAAGASPAAAPGAVGATVNVARAAALGRPPPCGVGGAGGLPAPRLDAVVAARGGGGLLAERAALAARLRAAGLRAATLPATAPATREAYALARSSRAAALLTLDAPSLGAGAVVRVRWLDRTRGDADEEVSLDEAAAHVAARLSGARAGAGAATTLAGADVVGDESEADYQRPRQWQRERARERHAETR
jgi:translation initiation factor 2-alpha kinase 4